jgi:hypothetical protein
LDGHAVTARKFLGDTIRLRSNQQHSPQFLWIFRIVAIVSRQHSESIAEEVRRIRR